MTKLTSFTPKACTNPFGAYHQAMLIEQPERWLVISGQLGTDPAGRLEDGVGAQTVRIIQSIDACLAQAGMDRSNIVRLSTYLIDMADRPLYMAVRDEWIGDHRPASTLLGVASLAIDGARIEIEAVAAG